MDGATEGEIYLHNNYKVGKTIGHGSFGKVKIAEHVLTGYPVAIKILNRHKMNETKMKERVQREIKICTTLEHPHIVRIYEVIETLTDVYIAMEYMKRGELFDYIVEKGKLQENEAQNLFQQIISGVECCHRNMVAHRDLKPENLLLDSRGNVKIADFGLSNIIRDGHLLKTSCGSPNYVAPEVISGKLYSGPEADVWSCGIILYALLCGKLPFDDENFASLFKKITAGIYTLPSHLSPGARDLIPRMLAVDPLKRMTIPEIRQHPWFKVCLPRYLAVPLSDLKQQIDEEILQEVRRKGFDLNKLVESLQNRKQNEATVAYHLLLDNRSSVSSGYLGAEIQESMEGGSAGIFSDDVLQLTAGHNFLEKASCWQKLPSESKWHLGIQSPAPPYELMMQVLGTLKELNVCWKKIGHYNVKCSWIHGYCHPKRKACSFGHNNHHQDDDGESTIVKFEIQLYRASEDKYLLDLKRVSGSQLVFLDFCAVYMMQLESH